MKLKGSWQLSGMEEMAVVTYAQSVSLYSEVTVDKRGVVTTAHFYKQLPHLTDWHLKRLEKIEDHRVRLCEELLVRALFESENVWIEDERISP